MSSNIMKLLGKKTSVPKSNISVRIKPSVKVKAKIVDMTWFSGVDNLNEIQIYLLKIVFIYATIFISNAQNISRSDYELWSWF